MKKIIGLFLIGVMLISNLAVFANANTPTTETTYVVERTNFERIPYMQLGDKIINVWGNRDIITLTDSDYKNLVQKGVKLTTITNSKLLLKASEGRFTQKMLSGLYRVTAVTAGVGYIVGLDSINPMGEPTQGDLINMFKIGDVIDFRTINYQYLHIVGLKIELVD